MRVGLQRVRRGLVLGDAHDGLAAAAAAAAPPGPGPVIYAGTVNNTPDGIAGLLYPCAPDPDAVLVSGSVRALDLLRCWLAAAKGLSREIKASAATIAQMGVAVNGLQATAASYAPGKSWSDIADAFTKAATNLYNESITADARVDGALATLAQSTPAAAPQIDKTAIVTAAQAVIALVDALLSQRNEAASMATALSGYAQRDIRLVAGDTTWAQRVANVLSYFNVFGALTGLVSGATDAFGKALDALAKATADAIAKLGAGVGKGITWGVVLPVLGVTAGVVGLAVGGYFLYRKAGGRADVHAASFHGIGYVDDRTGKIVRHGKRSF